MHVGGQSPPKNLKFPQTAAKLCALNLFLAGTTNNKNSTKTFFYYLFIIKFVQLGTQINHNVKKEKIYKNTQKVHYEVHKNHIIKSTSDSQNSEI